jgi:hypothetical protein
MEFLNIRQVKSCLYGTIHYCILPPSPCTYTSPHPTLPQKNEQHFTSNQTSECSYDIPPLRKWCTFVEEELQIGKCEQTTDFLSYKAAMLTATIKGKPAL